MTNEFVEICRDSTTSLIFTLILYYVPNDRQCHKRIQLLFVKFSSPICLFVVYKILFHQVLFSQEWGFRYFNMGVFPNSSQADTLQAYIPSTFTKQLWKQRYQILAPKLNLTIPMKSRKSAHHGIRLLPSSFHEVPARY